MNHPHYSTPVTTYKYQNNKYRLVCYSLSVGEIVSSCFDSDDKGNRIKKEVVEILETRDSMGVFTGYNVPKSYLAVLR